ncbi:NUDIX domain-containing protein [Caenimonas terrae]|uniref:NUDIX domain-containing protein n=1 Tax=Caenimonas terrae TaxID=696074 RepID=A0ABW0NBY5_9BURK
MTRHSAGLLMYRRRPGRPVEVLLAHPGGPYWRSKDTGAWTLPKGEFEEGEDGLACARREFREETGCEPTPPFAALGDVRQKSGKRVSAWCFEGDLDPDDLHSNLFEMEWPPRSGRLRQFPEVDRIAWYGLDDARAKLLPAQLPFLERLAAALGD